MASTSITIRMDENLKKQIEILFDDMGLNMTTAITLFAKAVVRENRIPFEIIASDVVRVGKDVMTSKKVFTPDCTKGEIRMADDFSKDDKGRRAYG